MAELLLIMGKLPLKSLAGSAWHSFLGEFALVISADRSLSPRCKSIEGESPELPNWAISPFPDQERVRCLD
jgi:hypothetical protein